MTQNQQTLFSPTPIPASAPVIDLDGLNPAQREAVECTRGPLLVLAGAGSGKTRVLTVRIAHMIADEGVRPWQVLAITFTNKAAAEMRERLDALLPGGTRGMWVCTFHAMCVRMLREDPELVGYRPNFTIYDDDDSRRLVKTIMADLDIDQKQFPMNSIRAKISSAKNAMVGPDEMASSSNPADRAAARVYRELDRRLAKANAMDFDDLLVKTFELLAKNPAVLERYQDRFRQISVDEYQDTNHVQYAITNLLAARYRNLMVVGDDDQSIYSWRGADIQNILDFEKDYPDAHVVRLEQNYRSTGHILAAANAVVANNSRRKPKRLFTDAGDGEKIRVFQASDERDEGRWIGSEIEKLHDGGTSYDDMAVFYRTNAQSRTLEDMFLRAGVPYRIVGGTRFFDRAEIRDVMAYLKLAVNHADDISCTRIINTPRRGIGKTTIERIASTASLRDLTFLEAAREEALDPACRTATRRSLNEFTQLIDEISSYRGVLSDVVEMIVEKTGLIAALEAQRTDEAGGRIENIREFMGVVHDYVESHEFVPDADVLPVSEESADGAAADAVEEGEVPAGFHVPTLADFMEWLSLRTDLDALDEAGDDYVTFMTVHSAKGLEFDNVFVAGMEEGIFPHMTSILEHGVEEERRLAYVAITRARKRLFMTHAQTRRIYNDTQANARSRFINEIPRELISHEGIGSLGMSGTGWEKRGDRHSTYGSGRGEEMYGGRVYGKGSDKGTGGKPAPTSAPANGGDEFAVGDKVDHKTFGPGTVLAVDGDKLTIHFAKNGKTKKLLKGYAPIVKVAK